jgi:protein-tyrosine phosphatase
VTESFDILVVCLGNVCRSPLAERLLRLRFEENLGAGSSALHVSSAGVRALVGSGMDESSAAELVRRGGDPTAFSSRQVTSALAGSADLVLTATRTLRSRVLEEAPRALKRTFTIREFAALTAIPPRQGQVIGTPAHLVAHAASWRGSADIEEYDVPDPIGKTADVHRAVADVLDADCSVIAEAITGALLSDVSPR